jgi:GNAT superfamily N-acetyltransferase
MGAILKLNAADARGRFDDLVELVRDSVASGASVGFLASLTPDETAVYWDGVLAEVEAGSRLLMVAEDDDGGVAGMVQLALVSKANGKHRAELEKLLVHTRARGRGLSRRLMSAAEDAARAHGVTLLVLDTEFESLADTLYSRLGYTRVGAIPDYAAGPDGTLHPTVIYYKTLEA